MARPTVSVQKGERHHPHTVDERIGKTIHERRCALDLSVSAACRLANLSEPTWRRVERGQDLDTVTEQTERAMARALRWPTRFLDLLRQGETMPEGDPYPNPSEDGTTRHHLQQTVMRLVKRCDDVSVLADVVERLSHGLGPE